MTALRNLVLPGAPPDPKMASFRKKAISGAQPFGALHPIPGIGVPESVLRADHRLSAQGLEPGYIQQLAGRAIGFAGISDQFPAKARNSGRRSLPAQG